MTPKEALELLDRVASIYQGTRNDHLKLSEAIAILMGLIPEEAPKPEKSK